jgi:hypothetical protein
MSAFGAGTARRVFALADVIANPATSAATASAVISLVFMFAPDLRWGTKGPPKRALLASTRVTGPR